MYTSKILLLVFIFIALWWGSVNLVKTIHGDKIPWGNFVLSTIGIVGIIAYFI